MGLLTKIKSLFGAGSSNENEQLQEKKVDYKTLDGESEYVISSKTSVEEGKHEIDAYVESVFRRTGRTIQQRFYLTHEDVVSIVNSQEGIAFEASNTLFVVNAELLKIDIWFEFRRKLELFRQEAEARGNAIYLVVPSFEQDIDKHVVANNYHGFTYIKLD